MEIVAPHASVIVPEVLKRNNYKRWRIFMQHYLVGQDLWDVVELSQLPLEGNIGRECVKKNALALHAIKISCGEEMFDRIKEINSAKDVWDALADMHKSTDQDIIEQPLDRRTGPGNLEHSQYETLTKAISNGDLGQVLKFFRENSNPRSARIFENGYTALHFAVYSRKKRIVDYLIELKLSKKDLETKDDSGSTALSIAARCGVGKSIAQSLVGKNQNLLTIPDDDKKFPVELACSIIQKDLKRYLYRKTPLQVLNGDSGRNILDQCITREMFDIAFDLLHHFPKLAQQDHLWKLILTLAQTQPPFFSRSNLSFWRRLVYNCIIVKAHVIKEDKHRSCVEKMRDFFLPFTEVVQYWYELCVKSIQVTSQEFRGEMPTIQENEETDQENQQTIQEIGQTNQETNGDIQELSFIGKCVFRLAIVIIIIALPVVVPFVISFILIEYAVVITLLVALILGGLILVALRLLVSMLSRILAKNIYAGKLRDKYACEVIYLICQQLSELDQNHFVQSSAVNTIIQAIKNNIPVIVKAITKANKNILWRRLKPEDSRNIFACAVAHHQEEVACLLYEIAKEDTNMVATIDGDGNNILHLAAKLAAPYQLGRISGSALQLQSELRWLKGVGEIVPRSYHKHKNNNGETPLEVFVREHQDLLKEAEEWGKKTAESSTVVGALIITIMFAVAFTVPGGNDQSTGFPILSHKTPIPFMIFMVSDALSLFAASSSVIIFLGILTEHQAAEDYRKYSLVINGLTYLFISIATMTIAFCAALFIMLQGRLVVVIPITLVAGIPIKWFVQLQFPLLVDIFCLTLRPNIFGGREICWIRRMPAVMVDLGLRAHRGFSRALNKF